jgi:hypothetical protein
VTLTEGQIPFSTVQVDTTTEFQTVLPGQTGTVYQTVYVTLPPVTQTQTIYPDQATQTQTLYPTWETRTTTTTPSPQPTNRPAPVQAARRPCLPGDQNETVDYGPLRPTHTQTITIIVLSIYIFVIWCGWSFIGIRTLLYPFKREPSSSTVPLAMTSTQSW